mmetsp:Transcript_23709/g.58116  ORF Transcript_23709/g.58116 Transcript_23709/m.58116 type:complete len:384 (+) Transcript_23709:101-1252(+)
MTTRTSSKRRSRKKVADPVKSDPCQSNLIHQLGKMIEYLDHSCTSAVDGIHLPSDSTTVLGDMDTVDLEQMEMDTITDTIGETTIDMMSASDIRQAYSYATGATDDASTIFSASTRTGYITAQGNLANSPSKSPVKEPVAKFQMVGRMHAKIPETNTSPPVKKSGSFEDSSIVTAPTDSFTSSKANDNTLVENLQNTTIAEEEKDEVGSAEQQRKIETESLSPSQGTASNASANEVPPPRQVTPPRPPLKKPVTEEEHKEYAIMQGLDLCRRIRQSYQKPNSSPIQYQQPSSSRQNSYERPLVRESSSPSSSSLNNNPEAASDVPKTKMYADRLKAAQANKPPAAAATVPTPAPLPPLPKQKSSSKMSQKLKGMVPFGRKASF